ncbi:hypothetical protein [Candidatus Magnetomonas plexicatena]|uniref:hypothetical protein n=1 Tax=Candidatus Magnetomonas plexicatena TaxID=2552947 RepID=UPI001101A136|nr:hypothetical protein E2O03_014500 [Nitrospirales bacterium LBB_01]
MIYDILNKERTAMMRHIEKIARTGPQKIAMIDLLTGKIETDKIEGTKLIMDKKLLDDLKEKVKFIEAGHFTDTGGAPTLKLIGEIMPVSKIIIPELDPNKGYPYIQGQLADKLGIKPYHVRVLVWKYKLKGDSQFHTAIVTSRSGSVHKFSEKAFDSLSDILREHNDDLNSFIDNISKEYNKREKHS